MDYVKLTDSNAPVISLYEAKEHLRIDTDYDDNTVLGLIGAAKEYIEDYLHTALTTQQWVLVMDSFQPVVKVYKAPILSIDSITYRNMTGEERILEQSYYTVNISAQPAVITQNNGNYRYYSDLYPTGGVRIHFTAGYDNPSSIPQPIILAMKMLVAQWYENREPVTTGGSVNALPFAVEALLRPYRLLWW